MIKLITTIFLAFGFMTSESFAGVRSIVNDSSSSDVSVSGSGTGSIYTDEELSYEIADTQAQCKALGFSIKSCPEGQRKIGTCPYDSNYSAGCCDPKYAYSTEKCIAKRMKPSAESCMGYYACEKIEGGIY